MVIRPADKGGAIVVLSKEYYNNELLGQLSDTNTYIKLRGNPTREYKGELYELIQKGSMKNILTKKEEYLIPETCSVPIIYTVLKIHKDQLNPPGRTIINEIQSINARLGEYVDKFMQPLVPQTPAYLRDMKHLIQKLNTIEIKPDQNYLIATADVSSLYTIIDHEEAIKASRWAMDTFSNLISKQIYFVWFILRCLAFGLQHNYFWYNSDYYRQLNGIGMGAKYASSVANIFKSKWKEKAMYSNTPSQLVIYRRFIDCIIIWNGDKSSLIQFFEKLNDNQKNIKLTYEISNTSIHFLYLKIKLVENGITTETYFKPVEINSYIPVDSCHFDPWLINIPKGQMIRLRRNCTYKSTFLEQTKMIGEKLINKGYNEHFIEEKIEEVSKLLRDCLIQNKEKKMIQFQDTKLQNSA